MNTVMGVVLALVGAAVVVLPIRATTAERSVYGPVLGQTLGNAAVRVALLAVGLALLVAGLVLVVR